MRRSARPCATFLLTVCSLFAWVLLTFLTLLRNRSLRNVETKIDSLFYNDDDGAFHRDMSLIFANARQFNPPTSFVVHDADKCDAVFQAAFKAMPPRPTMGGKRKMDEVGDEAAAKKQKA